MKIAVLFSGNTRTYLSTLYSFFDNLVHDNDIDIFIHSWNTVDSNTKSWWRSNLKSNFISEKRLRNCYKPTRILIEEPLIFDKINSAENPFLYNLLSMHYGIAKVFELFESHLEENNLKYDLVIRVRFDLFYTSKFQKEEFLDSINGKFVYVPRSITYTSIDGISDIFAFGPPAVMKEYSSFYYTLLDSIDYFINVGDKIVPEILLKNYLSEKSLIKKYTNIQLGILRSKTNIIGINYSNSKKDQEYPFFLLKKKTYIDIFDPEIREAIFNFNESFVFNNYKELDYFINYNNSYDLSTSKHLSSLRLIFRSSKPYFCRRFCGDIRYILLEIYRREKFNKLIMIALRNFWIIFFLLRYLNLICRDNMATYFQYQMSKVKHVFNLKLALNW